MKENKLISSIQDFIFLTYHSTKFGYSHFSSSQKNYRIDFFKPFKFHFKSIRLLGVNPQTGFVDVLQDLTQCVGWRESVLSLGQIISHSNPI